MRISAVALIAALVVSQAWFMSVAQAAAAASPPQPGATTSSGSCSFKTTEIAAASSFDQTNSASFVKLKEAGSITFTQNATGCVAGTLFGNAGNEADGDHVLLEVLLDGAPCAPLSSGYIFANAGQDFSSHMAAFFCGAKIAPGKHTVQVQFASGLGGNAEFFQRTLEVTHQ
jgi:hypothetical protein